MRNTFWKTRLVLAASLVLIVSQPAARATMATSDDACGSTSYTMNATKGDLVLSSGAGPIKTVITAIGETYTHSMLPHGNDWYSHSTMFEPGIDLMPGEPWLDEGQLTEGQPGFAQVPTAGLLWFLNGTATVHKFSGNAVAIRTADWLWNTSPYVGRYSSEDSSKVFYQLGIANYNWTTNNSTSYWRDLPYVMYQYTNLEGRHVNGKSHKDGAVCSTAIAHAVNMSATFSSNYNNYGRSTENNCPASWNGDGWCDRGCQFADVDCMRAGDYIIPATYSNALVGAAAQGLYDSMYATALDKLDDWSWLIDEEEEAQQTANQAVNCFAYKQNSCEDEGSTWRSLVANGLTATSISPNQLIAANSGSPWANAAPQSVRTSSAGSVYGCWF